MTQAMPARGQPERDVTAAGRRLLGAVLWTAALTLFLGVLGPVLLRPRLGGNSGVTSHHGRRGPTWKPNRLPAPTRREQAA